jgi:hypothetical protein
MSEFYDYANGNVLAELAAVRRALREAQAQRDAIAEKAAHVAELAEAMTAHIDQLHEMVGVQQATIRAQEALLESYQSANPN